MYAKIYMENVKNYIVISYITLVLTVLTFFYYIKKWWLFEKDLLFNIARIFDPKYRSINKYNLNFSVLL